MTARRTLKPTLSSWLRCHPHHHSSPVNRDGAGHDTLRFRPSVTQPHPTFFIVLLVLALLAAFVVPGWTFPSFIGPLTGPCLLAFVVNGTASSLYFSGCRCCRQLVSAGQVTLTCKLAI
jgi:hypothetical protein